MLFAFIGSYYSGMLQKQFIAQNVYVRKKTPQEMKNVLTTDDGVSHVKEMYTNIKISVTNLFLDPIICMFIPFSVCKNFSCRRRQELIALAEEKFSEDLDILSILKRLS